MTAELVSGWGGTAASAAEVVRPRTAADVAEAVASAPERGVALRGLGRSYGDAAQCAGGAVADLTEFTSVPEPDADGRVTVSAGTSLDRLLRDLVPRGWFVPVTPGTRHVTVGGAIAADVHGKNHHWAGTFGAHVERASLLLPDGNTVEVGPTAGEPERRLWWATVGGMGLTGAVLDATIRMIPIETSRMVVDTFRAPDLDAVMTRIEAADRADAYDYTVAWIDLLARGRATGRSVLTSARHARGEDIGGRAARRPLAYAPRTWLAAPPWVPSGALNRATIAAFNEAWYRRAPEHRTGETQSITRYFHPLDAVWEWGRLYGRRGFLQWQPVVPLGQEDVLRAIVERLSTARCSSFLAVLKRFGPGNPGLLSFPIAGWTLSLDIPAGGSDLAALLDDLDEMVAGCGGRVYLAKDSRLRPELLSVMYPRLEEWLAIRHDVDPGSVLQTDLARRLHLV